MAVKSIVDIDVNDAAFRRFHATYRQYQQLLSQAPKSWREVNSNVDGVKQSLNDVLKIQAVSIAQSKVMADLEAAMAQKARTRADGWRDIARFSKEAAGSIVVGTTALMRWTALAGIGSTLIGGAGIFGIDRLADRVSAGRRSSLGLGIGYGDQRAFNLNYGNVVDTGSFLSGVSDALRDVTKRHSLYGAGLGEGDLRGGTGSVAAALIPALKRLADQTPDQHLAQVLSSRGLNQFISLEDFTRIKAMSRTELAGYARGFTADSASLGLGGGTQRLWQDFSVQMSRAGQTIETVFIRGLTPLIPALNSLSGSVTKSIQTLLEAPKLKEWIEGLGSSLEKFAKYVGTDEFVDKVKRFGGAIEFTADKIINVAKWLGWAGGSAAGSVAGATISGQLGTAATVAPTTSPFGYMIGSGGGTKPWNSSTRGNNNPGNLRIPGSTTGFQSFATEEDGIRAIDRQLLRYQNKYGLSTIEQIIGRYAPPNENKTRDYIGNVSRWTGYDANQQLNLADREVMAKLIASIVRMEGNASKRYDSGTVVKIIDTTGGNNVVQAHQAGVQ